MSKEDYYKTLGLQKGAPEPEIKKAYRRKAMKYHPDRNPDNKAAEESFKEVKEAYEVLSDSKKRQAYDQFGHAGVQGGMGGGGGPGAAGFGDIFEDIFSDVFGQQGGGARGGHGGHSAQQRGSDLRYNLDLTLEQAVKGVTQQIRVPTLVACKPCDGSGAKKGSKPIDCPTCEGFGQVRIQQGFFTIQQTCPSCHGQGSVIQDPCGDCHGQGRVEHTKTLSVKIPAGVDTGDRVRLAGEGEAGLSGGAAGDLYVQVRLLEHLIFRREDDDLYCEAPLSFVKATLGGEIDVPTLVGRVTLKIPLGTQTGKSFRLRGKGVKSVRGGGVGDLFCRVNIETPINLSKDQTQLLDKFQESLDKDPKRYCPKNDSWFSRVKKFFEDVRGSA